MSNTWEEVPGDDSSPFTNVPEVDGIVYSEETISPELRMNANTFAPPPAPVYRPEPVRPKSRTVAQWQPGQIVDPKQFRPQARKPRRILQGIVLGSLPLAVFIGLLLFVMDLYGLR